MDLFIKNQAWESNIAICPLSDGTSLSFFELFSKYIPEKKLLLMQDWSQALNSNAELIIFTSISLEDQTLDKLIQSLKALRNSTNIPVGIYLENLTEPQKIALINAGVNEYFKVGDPIKEILAKMMALIRRYGYEKQPAFEQLSLGEYLVDFNKRQVICRNEIASLAPIEYRILKYFQRHAGMLLTHEQIFSFAWGADKEFNSHHVSIYIAKIRKKIGDNSLPAEIIVSDRGLGYRFLMPDK